MRIQLVHKYDSIISIENLLKAWEEFLIGKRNKKDVYEFSLNLMDNIISLHQDLVRKLYEHGPYEAFNISDPKPRNIHKASVRDRLLHHAIYRILYPHFDKTFYCYSYSCRLNKGTHRAINKFRELSFYESNKHLKTLWVLKCDIRKFFASVDHEVLFLILKRYIPNLDIMWLLFQVITSFHSTKVGVGLPLGNLTSQLLVNIYMNEFDQWMKHKMKVEYYIRYADDFIILNRDKDYLRGLISKMGDFLEEKLKLNLHPDKVFIKTYSSGIDFLGWVHFSKHRVLRTSTKRRAIKALLESENLNVLRSYSGLLKHGNQFQIKNKIDQKVNLLMQKQTQ